MNAHALLEPAPIVDDPRAWLLREPDLRRQDLQRADELGLISDVALVQAYDDIAALEACIARVTASADVETCGVIREMLGAVARYDKLLQSKRSAAIWGMANEIDGERAVLLNAEQAKREAMKAVNAKQKSDCRKLVKIWLDDLLEARSELKSRSKTFLANELLRCSDFRSQWTEFSPNYCENPKAIAAHVEAILALHYDVQPKPKRIRASKKS